jgi:hypothetical protein
MVRVMNSGSPLFMWTVETGEWSRRRRRRGEVDLLTALTMLVTLEDGVVVADDVSKMKRETREREVIVLLFSLVFLLSLLLCFSFFLVPLYSYCLPSISTFFPSLLSLLLSSVSFLFFPLFFRQLKSRSLLPLVLSLSGLCFSSSLVLKLHHLSINVPFL